MRASEEDVFKVFRFLLAPDTEFPYSKGTVRSHFVPVDGTSSAVVTLVRTLFRPVSKPAKSGRFCATSVNSTLAESHLTL
eukprot:1359381-Amphidinium_carterae.2